jgi:hypothetical protein
MRFSYLGLVGAVLVFGGAGLEAQEQPAQAQPADQAQSQDPFAEYKEVTKEVDGLGVYNQLLEGQIQDQETEIQSIRQSIEQVPDLERQIPPLLSRMIDGLEEFVSLDIPFYPDERAKRVADLRTLIERSDVNIAEKFRRVLEAWQVEDEYGRTMEAYTGQLEINGVNREVEFLHVGRIALLYQTPDGAYTGAWDQRNRQWVTLGNDARNPVRTALRMARAQVAPDLIQLPIPAPSEG